MCYHGIHYASNIDSIISFAKKLPILLGEHMALGYLTMSRSWLVLLNYTRGQPRVHLRYTSLEWFIVKYHNNTCYHFYHTWWILHYSFVPNCSALNCVLIDMCNHFVLYKFKFYPDCVMQIARTWWHLQRCFIVAKGTPVCPNATLQMLFFSIVIWLREQ